MKPKALWHSRVEYEAFSLDIFRQCIYQAVKSENFINYLQYAREEKGKLHSCQKHT